MFSNPKVFIPLTLCKLEMARGFEAVVELMHCPPGIEEAEQEFKLQNVMEAFWWIYKCANDQLGAASLPREMVLQGSSLSEN